MSDLVSGLECEDMCAVHVWSTCVQYMCGVHVCSTCVEYMCEVHVWSKCVRRHVWSSLQTCVQTLDCLTSEDIW